MQFLKLFNYFFFLIRNWNLSVACKLFVEEIRGEKKFHIKTTGYDQLKRLEKQGVDISHASIYMPASYRLLEELFSQLDGKSIQHFLDLGCGKGRALCVAAHYGIKKLTGVELSKSLVLDARDNVKRCQQNLPEVEMQIIHQDAFYFEIDEDVDCIFLFNPFDEFVMEAVHENIQKSLDKKDRKMTILYLNSLHKNIFLSGGFEEIYHTENLIYLQACILCYNPECVK